jgi:hypothetical protein
MLYKNLVKNKKELVKKQEKSIKIIVSVDRTIKVSTSKTNMVMPKWYVID